MAEVFKNFVECMNELARVTQVMEESKENYCLQPPSSMIWFTVYRRYVTLLSMFCEWIIPHVAQGTKGHEHVLELNILRIFLSCCFVAVPIHHIHKSNGKYLCCYKAIFILMYFCKYRQFENQQSLPYMSFHSIFSLWQL